MSSFYIDKILSLLIYPLGTSLFLGCVGLIFLLLKKRCFAIVSSVMSLGWLWFWSLPVTADTITRSLQSAYQHDAAETLPKVDVIVVLGGCMFPEQGEGSYPHLGEGADRVWHAARLYHAGRAPKILVSGGRASWQHRPHLPSEAFMMSQFLKDLGVPSDAILLEEESCNTFENALYSHQIMRQHNMQRALLVTSVTHMSRSFLICQKMNIDVTPAPTDFESFKFLVGFMRYLPYVRALHVSTKVWHEWVGFWVYRWRGWV